MFPQWRPTPCFLCLPAYLQRSGPVRAHDMLTAGNCVFTYTWTWPGRYFGWRWGGTQAITVSNLLKGYYQMACLATLAGPTISRLGLLSPRFYRCPTGCKGRPRTKSITACPSGPISAAGPRKGGQQSPSRGRKTYMATMTSRLVKCQGDAITSSFLRYHRYHTRNATVCLWSGYTRAKEASAPGHIRTAA